MSTRPITDYIVVNVSRQTTGVTRQGFGTALILAAFATALARVTTVTKAGWATTLAALGITSGSIYNAFSDYFAQTPSPNTGYLGRVNAERQDVQVTAYDVLTTYTINIIDATAPAGTNYTSLAAGSAALAATELAAAITGGSQNVTAAAVSDVVQITADPVGSAFIVDTSVAGGAGTIGEASTVTNEDMDDALTAVLAESQDWYGIIAAGTLGRTVAQQKLVAAWAESNERLYIAGSADANIPDLTVGADVSTSIAGYCKAQSYKNTAVIYNSHQDPSGDDEYHDAAWLGRCLQADPGTINWNHKNLSSVTTDTDITGTRRTNMGNKGCSWYETTGGSSRTQLGYQQGQNGYGDFIDVTRAIHWLKIRMEEALASLLQRVDKVPYTDSGIGSVKAEIRGVIEEAVDNGAVESYTIETDTAAESSTANKVARHYPGVDWTAVLAGAINSIAVTGTVTV